jgi:hypothetical protein
MGTDVRSSAEAKERQGVAFSSKPTSNAKQRDDLTSSVMATGDAPISNQASTRSDQLTLTRGVFGAAGGISLIASASPDAALDEQQNRENGRVSRSSKTILFNETNVASVSTLAGQRSSNDAKSGVANYIIVLSHAVIDTLKGEPRSSVGAKTPSKETDPSYEKEAEGHLWSGSNAPIAALMSAGLAQIIPQSNELASSISSQTTVAEGTSLVPDDDGKPLPSQSAPERQIIITLEPETIGPLQVRMTLNRAGISLQIDVASPDALLSLRASQEGLRKAIEEAGGKVSSLSMQLGGMLPASPDKVRPESSDAGLSSNFPGSSPNSEAFAGHGGSANGSRYATISHGNRNEDVEEYFSPRTKPNLDGFYL